MPHATSSSASDGWQPYQWWTIIWSWCPLGTQHHSHVNSSRLHRSSPTSEDWWPDLCPALQRQLAKVITPGSQPCSDGKWTHFLPQLSLPKDPQHRCQHPKTTGCLQQHQRQSLLQSPNMLHLLGLLPPDLDEWWHAHARWTWRKMPIPADKHLQTLGGDSRPALKPRYQFSTIMYIIIFLKISSICCNQEHWFYLWLPTYFLFVMLNTFCLFVFIYLLVLRTCWLLYTTLLLSLDYKQLLKQHQNVLQCMFPYEIYILKALTTKCNI